MHQQSPLSFFVECPSCRKTLQPTSQQVGQQVKCSACGTSFLLSDPAVPSGTPPVETNIPNFTLSQAPNTPSSAKRRDKTVSLPVTVTITLAAILVGYFVGREHMKHELRSAFSDAVQKVFPRLSDEESEAIERQPTLPIRALHQADRFSLALLEARIAPVETEETYGDGLIETDDRYVHFTFGVTNTDDRRILNYRKGNSFGSGYFTLIDDVGNRVRGVSFGFSENPIGTLSIIDDIQPGESRTHLEVFTIPPPKTEHLILTINLKSFGGDGWLKYKVLASEIHGFPVAE